MENINEIFDIQEERWLETLPDYQQTIIQLLYEEKGDYEEVAKAWLTSSISMTVSFGTEKGKSIYFEKILDEIELFLIGDEKYKDSRLAILKESGAVQNYAVGLLSVALSPILGSSSVFLSPVIAIICLTITKIGVNAWLAMRKEKRENNQKAFNN